ncbi:MAG: metalloregulator ArsR/SmtB family transcription factor [Bryobacteraceae bacterium]|nr:metalloregulator ArsR/SmtB family transcription factor [Bryobacteraceae bacterium]MDW8378623.1 metalloregulator ArsR/SmtB family transcription factor [Bryobacterales bacterium]
MPARTVISKELGKLLGVLSHPHRIRIIEELRHGEMDVNSLQAVLGVAHSGVSQHLSLLRSHRLVSERREGRHVYYQLTQPKLATWLMEGLEFLEANVLQAQEMREALEQTRSIWGADAANPSILIRSDRATDVSSGTTNLQAPTEAGVGAEPNPVATRVS